MIWVELVTCCVKFQLKMKSQKFFESLVEPVRDDQHTPRRLKSPQIKEGMFLERYKKSIQSLLRGLD